MSNGHWPFHLKVNGTVLKNAMVSGLVVNQQLGEHTWIDIHFRLLDQQRPPVEDYLGKPLDFFTLDEQGAELPLFEGIVFEVELEYGLHGDYGARVRGVTKSYFLDVTPDEKYFLEANLQAVASKIVKKDDLELSFVLEGDQPPLNYVQWGENDWAFLRRIADDLGCFVRPTAKGIEIRRGFQKGGLKIRWHDEYGLIRFTLRGRMAPPGYDGTCYDPRKMESNTFDRVQDDPKWYSGAESFVKAAKDASEQLPSSRLVFDARAPKAKDYQAILKKESARSMGCTVLGTGVSRDPRVRPGDEVELEGFSFDARGVYGIVGVVHKYDQSEGYRNEFQVTPWIDHTCTAKPAPRVIHGVFPARVVDHHDPEQMGRIRVQYDWYEDNFTGWVRMVTPHAGSDRGFMFMPEIGDEVLLAFEQGDPERPFVLGCLWNGVDKAPREEFWADDIKSNDVKRIVTKSGHRIQMVDTPDKEAITIATPEKLRIALIDNPDETGRPTIVLESDGDVLISAPNGRVHLRSKFFSREVS